MTHYLFWRVIAIVMISVIQASIASAEQKTPSQVFVEVNAFHLSLNSYYPESANNKNLQLDKIDIDDATSSDVYFLAAALNEKLRILLAKNDVVGFKQVTLSKDEITQMDIFELIKTAQNNLTLLTGAPVKVKKLTVPSLPSVVLREVIMANRLLDAILLGEINPKYPYSVVNRIQHELQRIYSHKGLPLMEYKYHYEFLRITPTDVFDSSEIFHNQLRLFSNHLFDHYDSRKAYYIPKDKSSIEPYHVFTLSVVNLYQIYLLENKLGLTPDHTYIPQFKDDAQPKTVYHGYNKVNSMLSSLIVNWH